MTNLGAGVIDSTVTRRARVVSLRLIVMMYIVIVIVIVCLGGLFGGGGNVNNKNMEAISAHVV